MKPKKIKAISTAIILVFFFAAWIPYQAEDGDPEIQSPESGRYLYVAVPGIRNYLGYGGHGILVFDMDNEHRFVKRIPTQGYLSNGVRPFTINSQETLVFANVDDLLGFEVGDLNSIIMWRVKNGGGSFQRASGDQSRGSIWNRKGYKMI
jgi:hypothetical protein